MTFWVVAVPAVVAVAWLVWWSSGRAKPDLRRRGIDAEIGIQRGRAELHNTYGDAGPMGGSGTS
jgi:hypothetical protein